MDDLQTTIREIQLTTELSAEMRNMLHGNTPGHPWAIGKTEFEMARDARLNLAGHDVDGRLLYMLERIARV
jgi:hypothetical protein